MTQADVDSALEYFGIKYGTDYARSIAQFSTRLFPDTFYEELIDTIIENKFPSIEEMDILLGKDWKKLIDMSDRKKMKVDELFIENIDLLLFVQKYQSAIDTHLFAFKFYEVDWNDEAYYDWRDGSYEDKINSQIINTLNLEYKKFIIKLFEVWSLKINFIGEESYVPFQKLINNYSDYLFNIPRKIKGI
jgi:hypothetical protein